MITSIQDQVASLMQRVNELKTQLIQQHRPNFERYEDVTVTVTNPTDISLEIFKTLPEFSGEQKNYATWRSTVCTAIKLLVNHVNSLRYAEALMIIRNKITGSASNILNSYNTAFHFDAIIDRLDFNYADQRPMYILEQELSVLQQNELTIDQFYDKVNEKLNSIVNKINLMYKNVAVAHAFIENASANALRTFITGLNNNLGDCLYASNPASLTDAYANLQTIVSDQERINFAQEFNFQERQMYAQHQQSKCNEIYRNPPKIQNDRHCLESNNQDEPMNIDRTSNLNICRTANSNFTRSIPTIEITEEAKTDFKDDSSIFFYASQ